VKLSAEKQYYFTLYDVLKFGFMMSKYPERGNFCFISVCVVANGSDD